MALKLTQSMEDYLEAIHLLELDQGNVRIKDIAEKMEITMPSVSSAIRNLEKHGLVSHSRYDLVLLTAKGTRIAEEVYRRHRIIRNFLSQVLRLDADVAERDACCMEHILSPETFESLIRYMKKEKE